VVSSTEKVSNDLTTGNATEEMKGWKTYTNSQYGFEIKLPSRWVNVQDKEIVVNDKHKYINFNLKTKSGGIGAVFSIDVFAEQEWDKSVKEDPLFGVIKIAEKNGYVFGYTKGQDDGGYLGFPEVIPNEAYKGPYYDVSNLIIPTFKFIK